MQLDRFLISQELAEQSIINLIKERINDVSTCKKIVDLVSPLSFGERYSHYLNILGVINAAERGQEGVIIECGVYKGGSSIGMILAQTLLLGKVIYPVYMLDSFMSMPEPTKVDGPAAIEWVDTEHIYPTKESGECYMDKVIQSIKKFNIDDNSYKIIQGYFEDTLPQFQKSLEDQKIVLLRLDADWYESTKICLDYLMPSVHEDGLVIVDDYHWVDGCALALHEYLGNNRLSYRVSNIREITYFYKNGLKWF